MNAKKNSIFLANRAIKLTENLLFPIFYYNFAKVDRYGNFIHHIYQYSSTQTLTINKKTDI
ncbi:MAG: hypothetical protein J6I72_07000, partial [Muribaculaceae bacterium]|nr:hypothetical protein [Muribaculaceae bacterium]